MEIFIDSLPLLLLLRRSLWLAVFKIFTPDAVVKLAVLREVIGVAPALGVGRGILEPRFIASLFKIWSELKNVLWNLFFLFVGFFQATVSSAKPQDDCTFALSQLVDVVLPGVLSSVFGLPGCLEHVLQEGLGSAVRHYIFEAKSCNQKRSTRPE